MVMDMMHSDQPKADEERATVSARTACGGKLNDPSKFPSALYRDEQIYFCTMACLRVFEQNPDPFMAGQIKHPLPGNER